MKERVMMVDPFRCRMWELHDRLDEHLSPDTCKDEIASFVKHGQLVPALAREVHGDIHHDYELVYGARRLYVARHLNCPLKIEVRELSDRDAVIAMDIENRQRRDVSPYERGRSYLRWLAGNHFQSQEELANHLKISPSLVCRLIKLAKLPSVIVAAFGSPLVICETWGLDLLQALEDPDRRQSTFDRARALARSNKALEPREIYRQLLSAPVGDQYARRRARDEVVKDRAGRPFLRIRSRSNVVSFIVPVQRLSERSRDQIRQTIRDILQEDADCGSNTPDHRSSRARSHKPQQPAPSSSTASPDMGPV